MIYSQIHSITSATIVVFKGYTYNNRKVSRADLKTIGESLRDHMLELMVKQGNALNFKKSNILEG
jgi:hypothetical protein